MPALVSIVLPVRDDVQRLPRSIESICEQSFADWELTVVDDGSTDGSREAAEAMASRDARIRVIAGDRAGQAPARNRGMAEAQGRWIAAADSDDFWHPQKLERQLDYLAAHPSVGVLGTFGYRLSAAGARLGTFDLGPTSIEAFRRLREKATPFGLIHPSVMLARELFERVGGYPTDYPIGTDLAYFNLRMAPHTDIVALPERLISVEIRPDSIQKRKVDHAFDVHEAVALNLRRQHDGLPEIGFEDAVEALAQGSPWVRFSRGRLRQRQRRYTLGASALAAGSPQGLGQLAIAFAIAPLYTTRRFASQAGALALERLRGSRAAAH